MPYLDASALVKLYVSEAGSQELESSVLGRDDLLISDLSITEVISALARRLREGSISTETAELLHRSVLQELAQGLFGLVELGTATHRHAERLLLSSAVPLRAGDALHLALAMAARAGVIVTFDERLARASRQARIPVAPDLGSLPPST